MAMGHAPSPPDCTVCTVRTGRVISGVVLVELSQAWSTVVQGGGGVARRRGRGGRGGVGAWQTGAVCTVCTVCIGRVISLERLRS